jgi:Rieske Fe-S protein
MARREFIGVCAGAAALLAGGACYSLVTHPVPLVGDEVHLALASYPELANPEGAIRIQPEGLADPIYVLVSSEPGGFTAVSPICTHRGCTVDVAGAQLRCPCHGSTYDRAGSVLRGPAQRPLSRYPVRREGGSLVIEVGA